MKLIVRDTQSSDLQIFDCKKTKDITKVLKKNMFTEEQYGGDIIYYIFVGEDGETVRGSLDFT